MPYALQFRTFPELLERVLATIRSQCDDPDLNIGSLIRGLAEGCSLNDAEQHLMIATLLDLFDPRNCKGDDLDKRLLEFGAATWTVLARIRASASFASIVVGDGTLYRQARLAADVAPGATSFAVDDGSAFPVAGKLALEAGTLRVEEVIYTRVGNTFTIVSPATGCVNPHLTAGTATTMAAAATLAANIFAGAVTATVVAGTEAGLPAAGIIIFDRGTTSREARAFTRAGVTLTFPAIAFTHLAGALLIVSTFGSDRAIATGSQCYAPESFVAQRITFRTTGAPGVLLDGDYLSAPISVVSDAVGAQTFVGAGQITKWASEPFANATVVNPQPSEQGADREQDDAYLARHQKICRGFQRGGTAIAIEGLVVGAVDPFSGKRVTFAQCVGPVSAGRSLLYISDGSTTFAVDQQVQSGRVTLIGDARDGDARTRLPALGPFQVLAMPAGTRTPRLFRSSARGSATTVGFNYIEDTTLTMVVNAYAGFFLKTDDDQFYEIVSNTAIRVVIADGVTPSLGAFSMFDFNADPLVPGTDYTFNEATGELELATPLVEHDGLVAADDNAYAVGAFTYARGLAAYVQRLVNGDRSDPTNFPGLVNTGATVLVTVPTIFSPGFVIQVLGKPGVTDDALRTSVKAIVQAYVNTVGMGLAGGSGKIVISVIIQRVQNLPQVASVRVLSQTSDITVLPGQLPRIDDTNVEVV